MSSPSLSPPIKGLQKLTRDDRRRPFSSPITPVMHTDSGDFEEESRLRGPPLKRPRTPSSVPPIPVTRHFNSSPKVVKSTESLNLPHAPTFDRKSREDRLPIRVQPKGSSHRVDESQQFCLKWNSYQTNLSREFDDLLRNEAFVDVTLACDGHSVKAHKMVLSACSPYFQALFLDHPCQHPIIIMKEVQWPQLKAVVEYMYRGEINVDREQIEPLLRVANMLKIRGLTDVDQCLEQTSAVDVEETKDESSGTVKFKNNSKEAEPLVDINENVEKTSDRRTESPRGTKAVEIIEGSGRGITVRATGHLLRTDSPSAAQERLTRANQGTRNRQWTVESSPSPLSGNQPPSPEALRDSPNSLLSELHGHSAMHLTQDQPKQPGGQINSGTPSSRGVLSTGSPTVSATLPFSLTQPTLESMGLSSLGLGTPTNTEDMEIKPGIAEMIREEERVSCV